jgi:hypothetical protein
MAGGLFPGHPFSLNIKCIIFTAVLAAGYWLAPHKNLWVLAFLIWFPYIALAWYDYIYDCRDKLKPTLVPFGRQVWLPFKPPGYKAEFEKLPPEQIQAMNKVDHIVFWTIIAVALSWFLLRKKV